MQAHFLYGLELGRAGQPAAAAEQFREAVRIMPDLVEARLNLGMALANEGNYSEALSQFEEMLQRDPTNKLALGYVRALSDKLSPTQSR
jgi:Tfp pilus assembly protein PilF